MDVYSAAKIRFMSRILDGDFDQDQIACIARSLDYVMADYRIEDKGSLIVCFDQSITRDLDNYFVGKRIQGHQQSTIHNQKIFFNSFVDFVGSIPTDEITTQMIERFLIEKEDSGVAPTTINEYRGFLHSFFAWAERKHIVEGNAAEDVLKRKTRKTLITYLKKEEIELVREYASPMDRLYIEFMYTTGARVSDVVSLLRNDISPCEENSSVYKVHIVNGKGGKERYALLTSDVKKELDKYLKNRKDTSPYLFVSAHDGKPITTAAIRLRLRRLSKKIFNETGVSIKMNPHVWRHTYATTLLRNGMDITELQKVLGHSSLNTTQIYAQQSLSNVIRDYSKFTDQGVWR